MISDVPKCNADKKKNVNAAMFLKVTLIDAKKNNHGDNLHKCALKASVNACI